MFACQRLRVGPLCWNTSKRLLSNEFKQVMETRLEPPAGISGEQLQLAVVSRNLNALNLDLFVNNVGSAEDRRSAVIDLLVHIRSSHLANTTLDSTNFAVVRHLLDHSSIQELVPILVDRTQYGIFLNNFTGMAVLEALHKEKEYELALPLVLKMILFDNLDSKFIQTFCVKSILVKLKKVEEIKETEVAEPAPKKPVGKQQEKKIRVKFLRNPLEIDVNLDMGKALLRIAPKSLTAEVQDNAKILGLVLTRRYDELKNVLNNFSSEISNDVLEICKNHLSKTDSSETVELLEKINSKKISTKSLEEQIDQILADSLIKDEKIVTEEQKKLFSVWLEKREESKAAIEKEINIRERKENIENITKEIDTKRQLLWFFDVEDKLDLEIYKKRVFYPKRWFGKKKKPRVVDENYVPPQIRKIN